ncbi:MAG: thermonuclease family protein [Acidimicrobiales bacterium]
MAFAALLVVLAAVGCGSSQDGAAPAGTATVERVVDGDTVAVRLAGGRRERVRLLGIDTPESVKPHTPVQCFAKEASSRLASLLPRASSVRLVRDVEERDRYGRLLAYLYRQPDGLFVNLDMARGGYAQLLTYPPNVAHVEELQRAVREARDARRGLWGSCPAAASLRP